MPSRSPLPILLVPAALTVFPASPVEAAEQDPINRAQRVHALDTLQQLQQVPYFDQTTSYGNFTRKVEATVSTQQPIGPANPAVFREIHDRESGEEILCTTRRFFTGVINNKSVGISKEDIANLRRNPSASVRLNTCKGTTSVRLVNVVLGTNQGVLYMFGNKEFPHMALSIHTVKGAGDNASICYSEKNIFEGTGRAIGWCGRQHEPKFPIGESGGDFNTIALVKGAMKSLGDYGKVFSDNPRSSRPRVLAIRAGARILFGNNASTRR